MVRQAVLIESDRPDGADLANGEIDLKSLL